MGMNIPTYGALKKYIDESILGISGSLAGKNCTVSSIVESGNNYIVTFSWTADDGTVKTDSITVKEGTDGNTVFVQESSTDTIPDEAVLIFDKDEDFEEDSYYTKTQSDTKYALSIDVGDIDDLETNVKTSIVKAINNVNSLTGKIMTGTAITGTGASGVTVAVENSKVNDLYINIDEDSTSFGNLYMRTDTNPTSGATITNRWVYQTNIIGPDGLDAFETWKAHTSQPNAMFDDYIEAISGEGILASIVWSKPILYDDDTDLKTWYYYKVGDAFDTSVWNIQYYSSNVITDSYTKGTKLQFKINYNGTTLYYPFTLTSDAPIPSKAEIEGKTYDTAFYVWNFGKLSKSVGLITYSGDANAYTGIEMYLTTLDDEPSTTEFSGYTTIELPNTSDSLNYAWFYSSSVISADELPIDKYAFWNGYKYYYFTTKITYSSGTYRLLFDSHYMKVLLFKYNSSSGKYDLVSPLWAQVYESVSLPSDATDMSDKMTLIQMGTWYQTLYLGDTKDTAKECTIETGASVQGFMTTARFNEIVGSVTLKTTAQTVKGAINELRDNCTHSVQCETVDNTEYLVCYDKVGKEVGRKELKTQSTLTSGSKEAINSDTILNGTVSKLTSGDKRPVNSNGVLNALYPVGSIYETTDTSFSPSSTWGGTWEEVRANSTSPDYSNVELLNTGTSYTFTASKNGWVFAVSKSSTTMRLEYVYMNINDLNVSSVYVDTSSVGNVRVSTGAFPVKVGDKVKTSSNASTMATYFAPDVVQKKAWKRTA